MEATLSFHILVTPYHLGDNIDHLPYFLPGSKIHGTVTSILAQERRERKPRAKLCPCNFNSKSATESWDFSSSVGENAQYSHSRVLHCTKRPEVVVGNEK